MLVENVALDAKLIKTTDLVYLEDVLATSDKFFYGSPYVFLTFCAIIYASRGKIFRKKSD